MGSEERELLLDAFDSNWIAPLGPHVDAFEVEMAKEVGVKHAAALSSGTAGLHLALKLCGVGAGDRVLVPSMTFAATANAVRYVGAEPVFVDCETQTWNMDHSLVAEELERTSKTGELPAAIITVDLYGQCSNYTAIEPLCERYGIPLIEDAAEALGASWEGRSAGSFGRFAVLSFNGNKIITTSGGGMLLSNDGAAIVHARKLATQARDPATHYQHSELGYNYRMSNLLAALGRGQLKALPDRVAARTTNFRFYEEHLAPVEGVTMMPIDERGTPNHWLTCIVLDPHSSPTSPEDVCHQLETQDIEARPLWKPMHMQPLYSGTRMLGGSVCEHLFANGMCLPSGSSMTDADRERVLAAFLGTR
ncbi:MAG: pyridoxal phosphate-dependent aminotransferase [Deltaproteobacteria bacterium]|nr:pyridoxal phosphate-dependent aminotransferase [Deltaproteobacteria bacterium]